MTKSKARPKWTVLYNIANRRSPWIGTAWEFFNSVEQASKRFEALKHQLEPTLVATMRPYHEGCDFKHLGAVHRMKETSC